MKAIRIGCLETYICNVTYLLHLFAGFVVPSDMSTQDFNGNLAAKAVVIPIHRLRNEQTLIRPISVFQ